VQVTPTVVSVSLYSDGAALATVRADQVTAFVDLAGLGPGEYVLPIHVDPPEHLGVTEITPATATVTIR
jgi:hypothetical protein